MSDSELDYLSPSFDASSLTVPRLRSILVSHDISYPASAKKSQLIEIFNGQLLPRSRAILSARARTKRTSKGIMDMPSSQESTVNGDDDDEDDTDLMPPPPVPDTSRRKSRTSGRVITEESTEGLMAARGQANRTSSRRSSTKHARASDTEAGTEPGIKRPLVRKTRRSEVMPTQAVKVEEPESLGRPSLEGSAFSYDNPFQSGSSPLSGTGRTSSVERNRKSLGASGERRKSSSRRRRTEGVITETSRNKQEDGIVVPTSETFDLSVAKLRTHKIENDDGIDAGEEFTAEEQLELVRERAKNGHTDLLPPRRKKRPQDQGRVSKSMPWVVILTLMTGYAAWWRHEKIGVGYCGLGRPSTMALTNIQVPDWASILQPECEPCPQHAYCYSGLQARCEPDFVLKPHSLSLGGLVPLPPTCEPDGEKVRRVKAVADRAVEELRERRAKWECGDLIDESGKEASVVEIGEGELKKEVGRKRRRGMGEAEFEELWKGAIGEIMGRDEVVSDVDGHTGHRTIASTSLARLPIRCAARRSARLALARYRVELAGLILLASLVAAARKHITNLRDDNARVPMLVSTTLDKLATQAALYTQGATPEAWISVGQLRDDVLRDEFSAKRRENLWKRVKAVVEMNANVRASVREGRGGEVSRVWEWIGSVGLIEDAWGVSGRRDSSRVSLGPVASSSPVPVEGGREMEQRRWDEGRPVY
ncbi:MAG: inner nuclear membrane protein enriched at telomere/subtelomere region [Pleopsidium flavum]|nr:MAG: inner nuclear membrane protein enriched at telomere/subtelomere region [Pleopsidium flavum]